VGWDEVQHFFGEDYMEICPVCDARLAPDEELDVLWAEICGRRLHHCDPKRLDAINNARKAYEEPRRPLQPSHDQRLRDAEIMVSLIESA
jgi:hypothetical protein